MKAAFDVLTQGWIPVSEQSGRLRKVGIEEVLKKAHCFSEISDPSPMVEYGMYRFLSVFLMDALRPKDTETLEDILAEGKFDADAIDHYIALCRKEGVSFDLFHPNRPFLQTPYDPQLDKNKKPAAALDYTLPSGNNHTHFDHRVSETVMLPYDMAARLLIPVQLFCTAGLQGPSNVSGAPPYYTIVKGQTLFETLLLSMIPLDQIDIPFDLPPVFWRNQALVTPKKKIAETSWLYGMLFPARRVTLVPGDKEVAEVYLSAGLDYTAMESWKDPFVTYRYIKDVRAPWRPNQGKAVWRNLNDLVDVKGRRAPAVLRQYFDLEKDSEDASIALYGVQTNQASFLGTFQYDLKIPARLTRDDSALRFLTLVIRAAENMEKAVRESLADVPGISSALISSASRIFYDRCESKFWAVCANLGNSVEALKAQYLAWCDDLTGIANSARVRILREAQLSGHSLAKAAAHEKDILFATGKNKKGME